MAVERGSDSHPEGGGKKVKKVKGEETNKKEKIDGVETHEKNNLARPSSPSPTPVTRRMGTGRSLFPDGVSCQT